jgi:ketosteroid isomerase-like protein
MDEGSVRETVQRYFDLSTAGDHEAAHTIYARDAVVELVTPGHPPARVRPPTATVTPATRSHPPE